MRVAVIFFVLFAFTAAAQCRTDIECKGDRVCVAGECRAPTPGDGASAMLTQRPATLREVPGWSAGGAVLGFLSGGAVMGLSVASALTQGSFVPSLSFGASATLVFAVTTPIVEASSASVRTQAGVPGSFGLRLCAWIFYGLTLANALAAVTIGAAGGEVPTPLIYTLGGLGLTTEAMFSIEALVARSQASDLVAPTTAASSGWTVRLAPLVAVAPGRGISGAAAMLGVGGSF
ncbi:MAG: hypothetical protein AB1938_22495 [Myxococcota bacterium]